MSDLVNDWGQTAFNYSTAACAFVAWDILISTGQEFEVIWRRPWTRLKSLYLFLRYGTLITQIVSIVMTVEFASGILFAESVCVANVVWGSTAGMLIIMGTQVVSMLRLRALYYHNPIIQAIVFSLFIIEVIAMFTCFFLAVPGIQYSGECATIYFPKVNIGYLISPVLFETLLFAILMVKFHQSLREGWGREPVMTRFMADGVWVFFFPFVFLTAFLLCATLIPNAWAQFFWPWTQAIPGFVGYRLILNMSHLLKMHGRSSEDVLVDTAPVPFGEETFTDDRSFFQM